MVQNGRLVASLFAVALALIATQACAAPAPPDARAIDAIFGDLAASKGPGCAAGVIQDGKLTFAKGYGLASLEQSTPITPQTVFDLGSISKQFMAATVMLLVEDGRLALDDDVRKYLPELPQLGPDRVTLRSMLHHTSGLRDYVGLMLLAGRRFEDLTTPADALAILSRQKGLNFPVNSRFAYCDTNYFLLSQVVERVAGKPWRALAAARLFAPLGMTHTEVLDDTARVVRGRAASYEPGPSGGFVVDASDWQQTGDGAVQTTLEDLVRWDANFYAPRVGGVRMLREMQTVGKLATGEPTGYGMGLFLNSYRGLRRVEHSGSWVGYRAAFTRFPDERTSVVVLCNVGSADAVGRANHLADVVLAGRFHDDADPSPSSPSGLSTATVLLPAPPVAVDPALYAGTYFSAELGVLWRIDAVDGRLVLRHRALGDPSLLPLAPEIFRAGPARLSFTPASGARRRFEIAMDDTRGVQFERVPDSTVPPIQ